MAEAVAGTAARTMFATRVAIGLGQGLSLYAIYDHEKRIDPVALGALALTAWLVPVVALGAIGELRRRTLAIWLVVAVALAAAIGAYWGFVDGDHTTDGEIVPAAAGAAAVLFILHHLITPADAEGRWRATYERYADEGWKDAVRLALAVGFVVALWIILALGGELFHLIGLDFLKHLLKEKWFIFTSITTFFALAIHLTEVQVGLVRGARMLALSLLSWLLVVATLIAVGFLAALPFRGLSALSAAGSASGVMLGVCGALVILMNAAYQEGEADGRPPAVLKWATRIAALTLPPLVAVAVYGVGLRIAQHGLSPARIYACACLVVAACYALGYAWAAVSRGRWMARLETTNWVTAQVVVAVLIALFSPLADPLRLSADAQVRRLETGRVKPEAFDYHFLHFGAGRWGREALNRLASGNGREKAPSLAAEELKVKNKWDKARPTAGQRATALKVVGQPLPPDFVSQTWSATDDPTAGCDFRSRDCSATTVALPDGTSEVIVFRSQFSRNLYARRAGRWVLLGELLGEGCTEDSAAVARGDIRLAPPTHPDVLIGGYRFVLSNPDDRPCAGPGRGRPTPR